MYAAAVIAVLITGVWLVQTGGEPPDETAITSSTSTPESTTTSTPSLMSDVPWVLAFDDNLGVVVLDPNDPAGARSVPIEGQRPGDQPYRLELVDGHLVVGWGEVYAVAIDTMESTLLGEATIFLPSAEPDRVWLVDYPGESIGSGLPVAWQVSVIGEPLSSPVEVDAGGFPAIGVPGGLAIETGTCISIWDPILANPGNPLGSGGSSVADVTNWNIGALAWCDEECSAVHMTEIASRADRVVGPDVGVDGFTPRSARFSSDGRYLAAPTHQGDVVVHDRETGRSHVAFSLPASDLTWIEWAPSGHQLFARSTLQNELTSRITYHNLDNGATETLDVSLTMGVDFVVVDEDQGRSLLGG